MATYRTASVSTPRTEFKTKEGTYRSLKTLEHCRPSRQPLLGKELSPVSVSFVSCKDKEGLSEWIAFNSAKELYFYPFCGVHKVPNLREPADKRTYKSPTIPVSHDFNLLTRSTSKLDLIVGFSTGPLQYINPIAKQAVCAFNEDGTIDKTRVTCVKWIPGSENTFVSSHRSGNLYVWSTSFTGKTTGPVHYTQHSEIQDATIYIVKSKYKSPLLFRWSVGHGAINSFAFSPNLLHMAIASQDGFLRIYNFTTQEYYGRMRSYFGGVLCVCWSPDGRYVVAGGEDDLISVWSFEHRRVVARGEGHQSYVTAVAFDPYTTILFDAGFSASAKPGCHDSEEALTSHVLFPRSPKTSVEHSSAASSPFLGRLTSEAGDRDVVAYRLGSVGQDAQLCLWDLSADALKIRRPFSRSRSRPSRVVSRPQSMSEIPSGNPSQKHKGEGEKKEEEEEKRPRADVIPPLQQEHCTDAAATQNCSSGASQHHVSDSCDHALSNHTGTAHKASNETQDHRSGNPDDGEVPRNGGSKEKEASPASSDHSTGKRDKKAKKKEEKERTGKKLAFSTPAKLKFLRRAGWHSNGQREARSFETCNSDDIAPKMHEVNLIAPLVAKKISRERLTSLIFREDCIVVANYEGFINFWVRPGVELSEGKDQSTEPSASAEPSGKHPGLNSPRPGGGPDPPLNCKQTTV